MSGSPNGGSRARLLRIAALALFVGLILALGLSAGEAQAQSAGPAPVNLCLTDLVDGESISGTVGSTPHNNIWAGTFRVTLDGGSSQLAFCTDLHNPIGERCYSNSSVGVTSPAVACMLQHYPPAADMTDREAAARQAAVWYFSDNFNISGTGQTATRARAIIADVENKIATNQCAPVQTPTIGFEPASQVTFLGPLGGGFETVTVEYVVNVAAGTTPFANHSVSVSRSGAGEISANGTNFGNGPVTVTTDANGQARVWVRHNAVGMTTLTATANVPLPVGTRIDPGPAYQKVVLAGVQNFPISTSASQEWASSTSGIVVKKFHDRNRNGVFDGTDSLIDWRVRYRSRPAGNNNWNSWSGWQSLGSDGSYTIGTSPNRVYEIQEESRSGWGSSTPTLVTGVLPGSEVWFGNYELPNMVISKFHDRNGNGSYDSGEEGLNGWAFQIDRWEDNVWQPTYSGQTAAGGLLGFSDIMVANYRVTEIPQTGWYDSTGAVQTVNVTSQSVVGLSFGNLQLGSLPVGKTWYSGGQPVAAPATPATVCVQRSGGWPGNAPAPQVGGVALAQVGGAYCYNNLTGPITITHLWPGSYTVTETSPAGWTGSPANATVAVGSGQAANAVNFRNDEVLGSLTVNKVVNWNGAEVDPNATFSICASGPSLNPASCQDVAAGGSYTWSNLRPGTYTVSEDTAGSEWTATGTGPVNVAGGQTATATVTNSHAGRGSLTVNKALVWNGAQPGAASFEVCISGPSFPDEPDCQTVAGGSSVTWPYLKAGDYTITEPNPGGEWTATVPEGPVTVAIEQNASATVTNTHAGRGSLTVTKLVDANGMPGLGDATFNVCISGPSFAQPDCRELGHDESATWQYLLPGAYTITEPELGAEWTMEVSGSTTVAVNQTASATVTNTHEGRGSLTINKVVNWANVTPDQSKTFEICITGELLAEPICQFADFDGGPVTFSDLRPGQYTVSETNPGVVWAVTGSGVEVQVSANATAQAEISNVHEGEGSVTVTKAVELNGAPDDGRTFNICLSGSYLTPPSCVNLAAGQSHTWSHLRPGSYSVTEESLGGDWAVTGTGPVVVSASNTPVGVTVTNTYVKPGSITVGKNVVWSGFPSSDVSFEICLFRGDTEIGCEELAHGETHTWTDLPHGVYTVRESDAGPLWSVSGEGAVQVSSGQDTPVTVTNTHVAPGAIRAAKVVDWNGYVSSENPTFTLCLNGGQCQTVSNGGYAEWTNLLPGVYTVSENGVDTTRWTVTGGGDVTVAAGQTAETTVTNTHVAPGAIRAAKVVNWNGATAPEGMSFSICITGRSYPEGNCQTVGADGGVVSWSNLLPDTYAVTEEGVDRGVWTVTGEADVIVAAGGQGEATITNTYVSPGSLIVTKVVNWNGAQPDANAGFTICITGPSYAEGADGSCQTVTGSGGGQLLWENLLPGDYLVAEQGVDTGVWTQIEGNNATVRVNADAGATHTITNTHAGRGSLTITKQVVWNGAEVISGASFDICITGPSFPQGDCQTVVDGGAAFWQYLLPGDYQISERGLGAEWTASATVNPAGVVVNQNLDVTLTNTHEGRGSLTVHKLVDWNNVPVDQNQQFQICITGPLPDGPSDCQFAPANGGDVTWPYLLPGDYRVTETDPGVVWTVEGSGQVVTVGVNAGHEATVRNVHEGRGSLEVTKSVNWNQFPPIQGQTFDICITGPSYPDAANCQTIGDGQTAVWNDLRPGAYTVSEPNLGEQWLDVAPHTVTVAANAATQTGVTNTHEGRGSLRITKQVSWNDVPTDPNKTFEICISGPSFPEGPSCQTVDWDGGELFWSDLRPGEYVVSETNPGGEWTVEINPQIVDVYANQEATVVVDNRHEPGGSLTVTKSVVWNGFPEDQTLAFRVCINRQGEPQLPESCVDLTYENGYSYTWTNLLAGDYILTEHVDEALWSVEGNGQTVAVTSGGTANAALTNTHIAPGMVQATKRVEWNGFPAYEVSFELCLESESYGRECRTVSADGVATWENLLPGAYTLRETDPGSLWTVTGAPADIVIEAGQTVAVEVTNTHVAPGAVQATKRIDWNGAPAQEMSFELCLSGEGYQESCQTVSADGVATWGNLFPGVYTVTETDPGPQWVVSGAPADIIVEAGQTAVLEVTNIYVAPGNIVIRKATDPAGAPDEFQFTATYSEVDFILSDGQSHDSGPLSAGVYSVSELAKVGWRNVSATCSDGSPVSAIDLAAGETVTCLFKNVKEKPGLEIKKYTNGEDADSAPGPKIKIGGKVAWQYVVRNTGQEVLVNIVVTDDKEGAICTIPRLAPGEFAKCIKTGKAGEGQYANIGTATGQTETGAPVSDSDPSHYLGLPTVIGTGSGVIGDRVWLDKNDNGIQDANEQTGIANVTVRLYTAAGELLAETKTDSDGKYLFEGLPAGKYFLLFSQPKGYKITLKNSGGDIGLDSDVDPVTRKTALIDLADGENDLTWDMGLSRTSTDLVPVAEPGHDLRVFLPAIGR